MNLTLKLKKLNQNIENHCKNNKDNPDFERRLGEMILNIQEIEDKIEKERKCKL